MKEKRKNMTIISRILNKRMGFFLVAVLLFWLKTYVVYKTKFSLGVSGSFQQVLLFVNPISFTLLLFGISLFSNGRKSYIVLLVTDFIMTLWLFANVVYYREFSDFMTINIIKSASAVSGNMDSSFKSLVHISDFFVFLDLLLLASLLIFKIIKIDQTVIKKRVAFSVTAIAMALFATNLSLAEMDRPQLLTRTFDRNYIIKYLGLNAYTVYDGIKTAQANATKANADGSQMDEVKEYIQSKQLTPNVDYFGKAAGKNVFVIHLESFQQFMIDYKSNGVEVTPTLNEFYHDSNTVSFDNFFHQVGQGKTSDAEMMLENSLYGLSEGSAMVSNGTENTFQAAPAILNQKGYTTAAFHGDVASFWNRDNTYKSWGYNYFFDSSYYPKGKDYDLGYGLKDKIFLSQSAKYLEQLPQPFYAKMITVTNHYPYPLDEANATIPKTTTGDSTVDGYVQTARYLDEAIKEFLAYLKDSGLYDDSLILMYGDHYGISSNHGNAVSQLLGTKEYTDFDDAMFQKVPFMIHAPGLKGGINHTYGGEIDVLPTLLHLLGEQTTDYIQFGSDLLATDNQQIVPFRNGDFVSKNFTKVHGTIYNTVTGEEITGLTEEQKVIFDQEKQHVEKELALSDRVITGDLLRFYTPKGFNVVDKEKYSYTFKSGIKQLEEAAKEVKNKTLLQEHNNQSTVNLYQTDAPELK
ncbi:exported glycerol phosphate lipoteichoic acid synthetase and anion-binding protein [Carnobacterium maltaromaticum]|uniref:LTA synthase family protein n=1 Tax=Carnobacterium maltaromaticum TaxID=2751 RepID=UPI00191BC7D0|nr:LTA synthase family protein [Carnobacterium maltaromaticum]CAD5902249.1 exported glycerol phosphate lipoteichoic acid synthetase and anion-binding protein [Carnobacterium maltaromaticum]